MFTAAKPSVFDCDASHTIYVPMLAAFFDQEQRAGLLVLRVAEIEKHNQTDNRRINSFSHWQPSSIDVRLNENR